MGVERPIPTLNDYQLELLTQHHLRASGCALVWRSILREATKMMRYAQSAIEGNPTTCWSSDRVAVLAKLEERMRELVGIMLGILIRQSLYKPQEQAIWRAVCLVNDLELREHLSNHESFFHYAARMMILQMCAEAGVICFIHHRGNFMMDHITFYNSLFNWLHINMTNLHVAVTFG